jgi:hypothetical protein
VNESALGERFRAILNSGPVQEIGAEMRRLGMQGSAELANVLFNGQGYVPYGAGQQAPDRDGAQEEQQQHHGMSR